MRGRAHFRVLVPAQISEYADALTESYVHAFGWLRAFTDQAEPSYSS